MSGPCVLLTAMEASGDALGAELMRALRARLGPDTRFIGLGGALMAAEGLVSAFDIAELSVFGLVDGLLAARKAQRRAEQIAELAAREKPDVAVLIDSWGFSYLLAKALRRRLPALKLVKYVAPQAWASRPGRAKALAQTFDLLLSIIAFEPPLFEAAGVRTVFVGHPSLAQAPSGADPERLRGRIGAAPGDQILLVLPGSRRSEVKRLLPPFGDAVRILAASHPRLRVVVAAARTVVGQVRAALASWPDRVTLVEDDEGKADAMAAATLAIACSGTVTTELAVAGCPMIVAYRLDGLTYAIAKHIVLTRWITLLNIAADAEVVPELIQGDCTGDKLAREAGARLDDSAFRDRQIQAQTAALEKLGGLGANPAERAVDAIVSLIGR